MPKYMTQSETFSNKTMALFRLTSLSTEHLMVCRALTLATNIGCRVHGCIVDAVLVSGDAQTMQALAEAVGQQRRTDGTKLFQIKTVTKKAPNNQMAERVVVAERLAWRPYTECKGARRFKGQAFGAWMEQPQFAHTRTWTILAEPEGIGCCSELDTFQAEAATAIVQNRGARVSGRGGVGKTKLIELLKARYQALN